MTLGVKNNKKRFEDLPPSQQKIILRAVRVVGLVGWLVLIGYGFYAWDDARFVRESIEDTAVVVRDKREQSIGDGGYPYSSTFRFDTADGTIHTVTPSYDMPGWTFREGSQITIRYRPNDPGRAIPRGNTDSDGYFGAQLIRLIFLACAFLSASLGTIGWISIKRQLRIST